MEQGFFTAIHKMRKLAILLPVLALGVILMPMQAQAQYKEPKIFEYEKFFAEAQNLLAMRPELFQELFFGLIDLRGNASKSRSILTKEVLECNAENVISRCPLELLAQYKNKHDIQQSYQIEVNFERLEFAKRGHQTLVTFHWRPALVDADVWGIEEFKSWLDIAEDSPYFHFKPGISQILFASSFERKMQVLMNPKVAKVLKELYREPNSDFKDSITFELSGASVSLEGDLASFNFFLKAIRLKVNHMEYPVLPYQKL